MSDYFIGLIDYIAGTPNGVLPIIVIGVSLYSHLYYMILKYRKHARQIDNDRVVAEKEFDSQRNSEILAVVKENTAAITQHTAVSSSLRALCESIGMDVKASNSRIHDKIEDVLKDTAEIKAHVAVRRRDERIS